MLKKQLVFSHGICNDTWINIFSQTFEDGLPLGQAKHSIFSTVKTCQANKFLKIVLVSAESRSNNALPRIKFRITILIEDHQ